MLAVDQQTGGELFGGTNRTAAARGDDPRLLRGHVRSGRSAGVRPGERPGAPLVLWGSSYSAALEQAEAFSHQGHRVFIADPGTHGSSMLLEERADGSTTETWQVVMGFLDALDG